MQPGYYTALAGKGAMDLMMTNLCPKMLDLALPMMLKQCTAGGRAQVPGRYLTNVPEYRWKWLAKQLKEGVLQLILGIPKGEAALQAAWVCIFSSKGLRGLLCVTNSWVTQPVTTQLVMIVTLTAHETQCLPLATVR